MSSNEENATNTTTDEEEKARLAAEARRKRIQQKSADRMKVVSGMQVKPDDEEVASGTSSAARMNAMRRRRFKKGAAKSTEATSTSAESATAEETTTPPATETTQSPPASAPPSEKTKEGPSVSETTDETTEAAAAAPKKFKGVAKMRREMIAKKKQEQAAAAQKEEQKPTPDAKDSSTTVSIKTSQSKMPILMYLVTTLLLFAVGVDVGLQHYDDNILVHTELVPTRQLSMETLFPAKDVAVEKDFLEESGDTTTAAATTPRGVDEEFVMENVQDEGEIDPLFGVDLDKLTKGPGIFLALARFAVSVHKLFLNLLFFKPLSFLRFFETMMSYPPVMCVAAVTLRQVVGKLILGAKLPEVKHEDIRKQSGGEDVLTMVKNMVKNFFTSQFPKLVAFYDVFTHAQADMFVVLCGMFVGLAFSAVMYPSVVPTSLEYDDVIPESIPETVQEHVSEIHEEL